MLRSTLDLDIFLDFWIFFFQARRTLVCFWYFVAGPVVKLMLRRPREFGRSGFSGRLLRRPRKKAWTESSSCLVKEVHGFALRTSQLCTCSAVLIYLDLR